MGIAYLNASGIFSLAFLHAFAAAALEIAGVGKIDGVGNLSRNRIEGLVYVGVYHRLALLKSYGIGVQGVVEDIVGSSLFDNTSRIHYYNLVSHLCNYAEIVGYQHNRAALLFLQVLQMYAIPRR